MAFTGPTLAFRTRVGTFVGLGYGASAVAIAGGSFGGSAVGMGGTAAWGGVGIYGTVTDPHFGGAYAGASGTVSLSSSSTTSQALEQRLSEASEAPDQRTACYPGCEPYSSFPDTPAGREAAKRYVQGSAVWVGSLVAEFALAKVAGRLAAWWVARGVLRLSTAQKGALLQAGLQPFPNSALTVAGRALTKHPELVGLTKATLNQTLRSPAAINAAAEGALRGILHSGTAAVRELGRFGMTLEVRAASGFGARFSQATGKFIGFITP